MQKNTLIKTACVLGALSVIFGAFGAHALQQAADSGKIPAENIRIFETAVRYQFYHTFALLALGILFNSLHQKKARLSATLFITGICLFSGSLYLLALSPVLFGKQTDWLGAITPLGGICFIGGWVMLLLAVGNRLNE